MTTTSGQNLSYNQTPTFKIPDFVPTPTQFRLLVANLVVGPPILQTIPSTEIVTLKTFELCESHSGYLCFFTVYTGRETILDSTLFFQKHADSNSNSTKSF